MAQPDSVLLSYFLDMGHIACVQLWLFMKVVWHLFNACLLQGSASVLETAAAEMGQAATSLVAIERQIGELTQQGVRS